MRNTIIKLFKKNMALGFTIAFAIITLILWLCSVDEIDFSDLWLNLLAGFIATICTITIIDSNLRKQKEKEDIPIRLALYRDVQLLASRIICLWQEMYEQCNSSRKEILIDDLFSETEIGYIYENLDLEGIPNVIPARNWYIYIVENATDFKQRGNRILDRYVSLAEPELFQAIHYLVNDSVFCERLLFIQTIKHTDACEKIPRVPLLKNYVYKPTEKDFESIRIINNWCRENYKKLSAGGNVYSIQERVVIMNPNVQPKSIMTQEKLEKCVTAFKLWQNK